MPGGQLRWDITPKMAVEIWWFSGLNFAGNRRVTEIRAFGGLQGDVFKGDEVKSLGIVADYGTRVTFMTSSRETGWEDVPYRVVIVKPGFTHKLKDGRTAVQIPDLDQLDNPDANRTDPDWDCSYPSVSHPDEGKGWTFGKVGHPPLKCNIKAIRIDKVDLD